MDFCILGLLMTGPQSLYQLNAAFERSLNLFYRASLGAVQAAVKKLLAAGYIEAAGQEDTGRRAKYYRIRDEGRAFFFSSMLEPLPESRLEETALARYFFLSLVPRRADRIAILDRIIADADRSLAGLLANQANLAGLELPSGYAEAFAYQTGTLSYGIAAHRAALRWFKKRRAEERARAKTESAASVRAAGPERKTDER